MQINYLIIYYTFFILLCKKYYKVFMLFLSRNKTTFQSQRNLNCKSRNYINFLLCLMCFDGDDIMQLSDDVAYKMSFHYLQMKSTIMLYIVTQFNGNIYVHNDILNTNNTLQIMKETIFKSESERET